MVSDMHDKLNDGRSREATLIVGIAASHDSFEVVQPWPAVGKVGA
jgi:hypothetical protein